jgi:hypothetical protein
MPPRTKFLLLLALWIVPYMGLVLYSTTKIQNNRIPMPYAYAMAAYFFGGLVLFGFLGPRIFRGAPPPDPEKAQRATNWAKAYGTRLVLVWSGMFVYGVYEAMTGAIPWDRAIPAGVILLAFILLFGWNVLSLRRS